MICKENTRENWKINIIGSCTAINKNGEFESGLLYGNYEWDISKYILKGE